MSDQKTCTACKITKPIKDFATRTMNGRQYPRTRCRPCESKLRHDRWAQHQIMMYGSYTSRKTLDLQAPRRTCIKCEKTKIKQSFRGNTAICLDCFNNYQRSWYWKNRRQILPKLRQKAVRHRRQMTSLVTEMKRRPCLDCRQSFHPCAMDFDHRNPKTKISEVASMVGGRYSKADIMAEIKKCDLVCSNCHRVRTYKRRHGEAAPHLIRGQA